MSTANEMWVRLVALVAVCVLSLSSAGAQPMSASRIRHQSLSPSVTGMLVMREDGRIQRLILLRGRPGWFLGEATKEPQGSGLAPGVTTGSSFSVDISDRRIVIQGVPHDLGQGDLVLVDDMDLNGERATVSTATLGFDGLDRNAQWLEILRRSREAVSFLRCGGESIQRKLWNVPAQINDALNESTTRRLNAYVCDDLVRLGMVAK